MRRPRVPTWDINPDELLTWAMQLRREGTLPLEVQWRLLEHLAEAPLDRGSTPRG